MNRLARYSRSAAALAVATLAAMAGAGVAGAQVAAPAHAAHPAYPTASTKWTQISTDTHMGFATPGLFRSGDGRLHVIWPRKDGLVYSMHFSTVGGREKLLATGTVVSHWAAVSMSPGLVPDAHGGLQLLMTGGNGVNNSPYNTGAIYVAKSNEAGKSWALVPGSMSQSTLVTLSDAAAATESNGTPVASWSEGNSLAYHVGIDPTNPATSPDQHLGIGAGGDLINPTVVRTPTGAILAGWFNSSFNAKMGYWTAQIGPKQSAMIEAPGSRSSGATNNQPLQPVALAAHPGGGSYLAYCVVTKSMPCGHIALWRVGAAKAMTVPGSASGQARRVAIAAGHGGHLWISWFNVQTNKISVVRTNAAVTGFGLVRTISAPSPLTAFLRLFTVGGSGPLDIIALATMNRPNFPTAYFDTQLFPALRIKASKSSVSNKVSTTITFTVDDSGDGVPGATVTFLGKTAKTNSKGVVKFTVKKGTAKGRHIVEATKTGYAPASFTVKVT